MSEKAAGPTELPALKLLELEQSEFERFLHDELGQCLVAIRSMAAALNDDAPNEIAQLISQAADDAYIDVYDRMMELRAERLAQAPGFGSAIQQCIGDARLEARNLRHRLNLDESVERLSNPLCQRLLLRSLHSIVIVIKRLALSDGELLININSDDEYLVLAIQFPTDGFPEAYCEHPRIARLADRLHEFSGELSQGSDEIRVRLPCSAQGAG